MGAPFFPSFLASVDLSSAFLANDWFGKLCIFFIMTLSVISATVAIQKYLILRTAKRQDKYFQRLMNAEGTWDTLFLASKKYDESPLARLLREVYMECRLEKWFVPASQSEMSLEGRLDMGRRTVEGVLNKAIQHEEQRFQQYLGILATTSTLAPFIGLLGTVWGILAAFQMIGKEGSAALSALAPGISTALMTTICGLIVAIPVLFVYNYILGQIRGISHKMETFSQDIENAVRKQIAREKGAPR